MHIILFLCPSSVVFSGKYKGGKVAIKSLKDDHKGLQEFLVEASVMTSLSHPNLVNLIGVSVDQKPVYIITEFVEKGSLIEYLQSRGRSVIQRSHQIGFAKDVVNGMVYLERKDLVHRFVCVCTCVCMCVCVRVHACPFMCMTMPIIHLDREHLAFLVPHFGGVYLQEHDAAASTVTSLNYVHYSIPMHE